MSQTIVIYDDWETTKKGTFQETCQSTQSTAEWISGVDTTRYIISRLRLGVFLNHLDVGLMNNNE